MAPQLNIAIPTRTTPIRLIEMLSGPKVDIFVGEDKKHYSIPKQLLVHHSIYFDRCFNGGFIEGQTQKLELPEDTVDNFDVMLEYMIYGTISGSIAVEKTKQYTVSRCLEFLTFVDKYGFAGKFVEAIICKTLREGIMLYGNVEFDVDNVKEVYRTTRKGSPLRALMAEIVLSFGGIKGENGIQYKTLVEEVDGLALDVLLLTRASIREPLSNWKDPFTGKSYR